MILNKGETPDPGHISVTALVCVTSM